MSGYVYFIESHGRVKVGFSENPKLRLVKINSDCPFDCALIGYIEGNLILEAEIQSKFSSLNVCGEWFEYKGDLKLFIQSQNFVIEPVKKPKTVLENYLKTVGETVSSFSKRSGITHATISRSLRGLRQPRDQIALLVEKHTKGQVSAKDFVSDCFDARQNRQSANAA